MGSRLPHRGAENDRAAYAKRFVTARVAGFEKDIQICLTPIPSTTRPGSTHAYFPALGACCCLLEYLTVLYRGRTDPPGWRNVSAWAQRYMLQPDYDEDRIRILVDHFRNSVAHRGIASGVWIDKKPGPGHGRRLTWKVFEDSLRPSIQVVAEEGQLLSDPPWPCSYTHRVYIHLESLAADIQQGALLFADAVSKTRSLLSKFFACMEDLYPN
jgi:hypothetical protein